MLERLVWLWGMAPGSLVSMAGLLLDIVGVGFLVNEWRLGFAAARLPRVKEEHDFLYGVTSRGRASRFEEEDREHHRRTLRTQEKAIASDAVVLGLRDETFAIDEDKLEQRRLWRVRLGASLVFFGFILQLGGTWMGLPTQPPCG